jgi:hypothetical protein
MSAIAERRTDTFVKRMKNAGSTVIVHTSDGVTVLSHHASLLPHHHDGFSLRAVV